MTTLPPGHLTLQQIRNANPCREGWAKLLASLGGYDTPLDTVASLGDVARSNGADDAWWCARGLSWSDVAARRPVIAAFLPTLRRAADRAQDTVARGLIAILADWCADADGLDLPALVWEAKARAADVQAARAGRDWLFLAAHSVWQTIVIAAGPHGGMEAAANYATEAEAEVAPTWRITRRRTRPTSRRPDRGLPAASPRMTGAEYRTLREACGLSAQEAADLHRVGLRTVGHWDIAVTVPAGVAADIRALNTQIQRGVDAALQLYRDMAAEHGAPDAVTLVRYRSPSDYAGSRAAREGLPWPAHRALVMRTMLALEQAGAVVVVEWGGE